MMADQQRTLFDERKPLGEICDIPREINSVYTLEQHIWSGKDAAEHEQARAQRLPQYQTIEEFQINPMRSFLTDIFRHMAAPYKPERRDNPIGQGYWIQAEFGSGKSHLLCVVAALALGDAGLWELVRQKETRSGLGRRESLYRFWEEGLQEKSSGGQRGIFVIAKTLVGAGGGMVGMESNQRLIDYILEAAREQLLAELGRNISLYPVEVLADRFLEHDLERYREDLRKFLRDPRYFAADEQIPLDEFLDVLQSNRAPEYKRDCGNKLWLFYEKCLQVRPQNLPIDAEEVLKHMVETILQEGYSGVLLILDEVSLFMKNRNDDLRQDDENTLIVLSNRLTRVYNLPIWTVCSAQQAIESQMGVRNIIADERLKQVLLLKENDDSFYEIMLARVRTIKEPDTIGSYYEYYRKHFSSPAAIGEEQFRRFFPFHKPALEVLRVLCANLTNMRSALHFMHETLRRLIKTGSTELISLWQLFEEAVNYEEDPSGMSEGLAAIKLQYDADYTVYINGKRQIDALPRGLLKFHHDKAVKILQTLFLYHIGRTRQQGLLPEELANAVLVTKDEQARPEDNIDHYMSIASMLSKELQQVVESPDTEGDNRYRFEPTRTGISPRNEFQKARAEVERSELLQKNAWSFLLGLTRGVWVARARQFAPLDLASGNESPFAQLQPAGTTSFKEIPLEIIWQGRLVSGTICLRDLADISAGGRRLPSLNTAESEYDFAIHVSTRPVSDEGIEQLFAQIHDPRIITWCPAERNYDEQSLLYDLAAYRRLHELWNARDSEEAEEIIRWLGRSMQNEMGRILRIIDGAYGRGRIDSLDLRRQEFHMGGGLSSILTPVVGRVLSAAYASSDLDFKAPAPFRGEEAVKVINGIVRVGEILRDAKFNKDLSAVQNYGLSLGIVKRRAEKRLDVEDNRYVQDIAAFLDEKLDDDERKLPINTLYANFMGVNGYKGTSYGLSRRMVQLYLLCLAQGGKIRLALNPKAGLSAGQIDYTNIKGIEFTARLLEAITEVQRVARPKNWELFRPFAMALLRTELPREYDDREVAAQRAALRELFDEESSNARRVLDHSLSLCEYLQTQHPYEEDLELFARFFALELGHDEIDAILAGLDETFAYRVYQGGQSDETEIGDFRNRYQHYVDSRNLLNHADRLRQAFAYSQVPLPDDDDLREASQLQAELRAELAHLQRYIDSELLLRTRLLGPDRDEQESATETTALLPRLITAYSSVYENKHNDALSHLEQRREQIQHLLESSELRALAVLERVSALQPASVPQISSSLAKLKNEIRQCPESAHGVLRARLWREPIHLCGISLANARQLMQEADNHAQEAERQFNEGIEGKLEVFLNPAIRERLQQGKDEEIIAGLLACTSVQHVRASLLPLCLREGERVVETISRYLRRIVVRKVNLAQFKASRKLVEREQVAGLASEFQKFLEGQFAAIDTEAERDTLPILEIE